MLSIMFVALFVSFLLKTASGVNNVADCPRWCDCKLSSSDSQLTVDCGRNFSIIDVEQLYQQLDIILSSDHIREHLISLSITNTPLTKVTSSLCQLLNLTYLDLNNNRITELPDNCFTKLTKLVTFSAHHNLIVGLQDGLFDGLQSLESLGLCCNKISFIGLRLFSNASDLTSLRTLNLESNQLTSLEPWWYYRSIQGSEASSVLVSLRYNLISKFTNKLNFSYRCGMKKPIGYIDLECNQVSHITDLVEGWNISDIDQILCLFNHEKWHTHLRFYFGGFKTMFSCDCADFWVYRLVRTFPKIGILRDVRCNNTKFSGASAEPMLVTSIPLDEFTCDLSEHCPLKCRCVYRPANATLHVYCSAANLSSLPLDLPPLPKTYVKYKLDFSNNKLLRHLGHCPYFVNTSILDVSNCGLTEISLQVLKDLSGIKIANFHRNMIQSIPQHTDTFNISSKLYLGANPWKCFCGDSWMIGWLQSYSDHILDPADIVCRSPSRMYGRNVLTSTQEEFCVDPVTRTLKVTLSPIAAVSFLLIIGVIIGVVFYRRRVSIYARWKFHPFDRDECEGEGMVYDVFLSCSSLDDDPHGRNILDQMESKGYLVCYHERDFLPGELVSNNIANGIERSKRTVCLLSENFLRSGFCMHEFQTAHHHNIVEKRKKRLIVLMMLDSPNDLLANDDPDTAVLRQFLCKYTYIVYTAADWLDRLLYALPLHGMNQVVEEQNATVNQEDDDASLLDRS